ncbi:MAG: HAD family hydrolase [Anaerolineae bacterium]
MSRSKPIKVYHTVVAKSSKPNHVAAPKPVGGLWQGQPYAAVWTSPYPCRLTAAPPSLSASGEGWGWGDARLGVDLKQVTMVGDSWRSDVGAALAAGVRAVWLNRGGRECPDPGKAVEIQDLRALPTLLHAHGL